MELSHQITLETSLISYVVGVPNAVVALQGAAVTAVDGYNVTLQLTEAMRVGTLFLSSVPAVEHGDGVTAAQLVVPPGVVRDIGENRQTAHAIVPLVEFPDRVRPKLLRGVIDYNDGRLVLYPSETVRRCGTPRCCFSCRFHR